MIWVEETIECSKVAVKKLAGNPPVAACSDGTVVSTATGAKLKFESAVNALTVKNDELVAGLSSGKVFYVSSMEPESGQVEIYKHDDNVCSLDFCGSFILSGSWDNSAVLYNLEERIVKKFKHPASIWAVKCLNDNSFVTGCADGCIRIFVDGAQTRSIEYHTGPVRSLLLEVPEGKNGTTLDELVIYSVDNHGTVLKCSGGGKLLAARKLPNFLFCSCRWNDRIVVAGDEGDLFVLTDELQVESSTQIQANAIWDVRASGDKLYASASDGKVYILNIGNKEPEQGDKEIKKVEKMTSGKELKTFTSEGEKYKVEDDNVYVDRGTHWELLGSSVQKWDHSFKVSLGNKDYTLPFNDNENTEEIARRFLHENHLGAEFHKEIVDYINDNFRRSTQYKRYENIDLKGIEKCVGPHPILSILREIGEGKSYGLDKRSEKNVYVVEKLLWRDSSLPLFIVLDICKFLVAKKVPVDLSFLMDTKIETRKDAMAFVFLMTNLVEDPPFAITKLDHRVKRLRDVGLLHSDDVHAYEENKNVKKRQGNK